MRSIQNLSRGDVVRVRLDPVEGSEQAGERPALIISPTVIIKHSSVILVAAITSKKTDRLHPFETLIVPPEGGLLMKSKVMLTQMRSIDKSRITRRYGCVSDDVMLEVENAIRVATGLTKY